MSNAKRAPDTGSNHDRKTDSTVSGERPALQHTDYAGLSSLGSEAFRVPLPPPPQSEPPVVFRRVRLGLYVLGAAVGLCAAAVGVASVLRSEPASEGGPLASAPTPARAALATVAAVAPERPAAATADVVEPSAQVGGPNVAAPVANAAKDEPPSAAPAADEKPDEKPDVKPASSTTRARRDGASRTRRRREAALPAHLAREQVIASMNRVQPAVAACFGNTHGSAMANITVVGRTGRVTAAQVKGQTGSVGSCIARAVRRANFPRFADESLTVSYPFAH